MAQKQVLALVKIQIPAGQASPAPPVGTALGPHGVAIMDEKLEIASGRIPSGIDPSQASSYIVNPLKAEARGRGGSRVFSTHPPTAERVERLRNGSWNQGTVGGGPIS